HAFILLGQLPLNMSVREQADRGQPLVSANPSHPISQIYLAIAQQLRDRLALQKRSFAHILPRVVVERSQGDRHVDKSR
ncbi:MAG TPA: hypothetical protein VI522_00700, partial [Gammaproteobacteria bacterium]|nr:hypothetical protein [Gammaproteobacteria bacterium]